MFYHHRAKEQDSRDRVVGQFDDLSVLEVSTLHFLPLGVIITPDSAS